MRLSCPLGAIPQGPVALTIPQIKFDIVSGRIIKKKGAMQLKQLSIAPVLPTSTAN